MYLPSHFREANHGELCRFIEETPLAQLFSFDEKGELFLNPLPLHIEDSHPHRFCLVGHMSRVNQQVRHFAKNKRVHGSFLGATGYVSPLWYGNPNAGHVPTWNYVLIEFRGTVELVETYDELVSLIKTLSNVFESRNGTSWAFDIPADLNGALLTKAIVGIRIRVEHLVGKFKLSQNRTLDERKNLVKELEGTTWHAPTLADMMKKSLKA